MNQSPLQIVSRELDVLFQELSQSEEEEVSVDRNDKNYDDAKIQILADKLLVFLSKNPSKKVKLNLGKNSFGPAGCKSLMAVMQERPHQIIRLNLADNNVVDEGAGIIAEALQTNNSVKTLILNRCLIDTGIEKIGDMLKVNTALTTLDVANNHFLNVKSKFTIPESLYRLADGYAQHPPMDLILTNLTQVRLEFIRCVVQVEEPGSKAVDMVLRHEDDQKNAIISHLVRAWRKCKQAGEISFHSTQWLYTQVENYQKALGAKDEELYEDIRQNSFRWIDERTPFIPAPETAKKKRGKIILLGDKNSGKSTLVKSLAAGRPVIRTKGDDMVCAKVKKVTIKGVDCALYEVAGHKAFRGIPTLFMSPKSIAIITVNISTYNPQKEKEYFKKVHKWIDIVKYHISNANIFVVGTYAERLGDNREERERRVEHISENLHEWIANGQRLKENNQKFFNDRVAGHYRQGDIPQIDWIESYIPLPKAKNIFLDAHHARNMPCVVKPESEKVFPGDTITKFAEKFPHVHFTGPQATSIFEMEAHESAGLENLHMKLGNLLQTHEEVHEELLPKEVLLASELERIGQNPDHYVISLKDLTDGRKPNKFVLADAVVGKKPKNQVLSNFFVTKNRFANIDELRSALKKMHTTGHILWYSKCENLNNWIFPNVQWVSDMIGSLIRFDAIDTLSSEDQERLADEIQRFKTQAVLPVQLLHSFEFWKTAGKFQRKILSKLLNELDLLCWAPQRGVKDAYFVPFQLRNSSLKVSARPYKLPPMPEQLRRMVPEVKFGRSKFTRDYYKIDDSKLDKRHVQYQFLCVNGFAEGVFCRFLARIQPYVELDLTTVSKMGVVARDAADNTFLIEEHKFYYKGWNRKVLDSGGALLITGLKENVVNPLFWETMVLLTDEADRMVDAYSGILSGVFITYMDLTQPNRHRLVIGQRRKLEFVQKKALESGIGKTSKVGIYLYDSPEDPSKAKRLLLSVLLPEVITSGSERFPLKPISTRRNNFLGKANAIIKSLDTWLEVNRQVEDESRMKIIHFELAQLLESFLQYFANKKEVGQSGYRFYCENIKDDEDLMSRDKAMHDEVASIYGSDVTGATRVTMNSNDKLMRVCKVFVAAIQAKVERGEFKPAGKALGGYVNAG